MPVFGPADDEKSSGGSAGRASPVSLFAIPAPVLLPVLFRGLLFGLLRVIAPAILSGGGLPFTRVVSRLKAKFSSCCDSEFFRQIGLASCGIMVYEQYCLWYC